MAGGGQVWRCSTKLGKSRPRSTKFGRSLVRFGQCRPEFGPTNTTHRPSLAQVWKMLAKFGQHQPNMAHLRANVGQVWAESRISASAGTVAQLMGPRQQQTIIYAVTICVGTSGIPEARTSRSPIRYSKGLPDTGIGRAARSPEAGSACCDRSWVLRRPTLVGARRRPAETLAYKCGRRACGRAELLSRASRRLRPSRARKLPVFGDNGPDPDQRGPSLWMGCWRLRGPCPAASSHPTEGEESRPKDFPHSRLHLLLLQRLPRHDGRRRHGTTHEARCGLFSWTVYLPSAFHDCISGMMSFCNLVPST